MKLKDGKYFDILVNVKNQEESMLCDSLMINGVIMYEKIPNKIKSLKILTTHFQPHLVKEIHNIIKIPLIVRVREGNISELNILKKMNINYFYEICDIYSNKLSINNSIIREKFIQNSIFMCKCSNLFEGIEKIKLGINYLILGDNNLLETFRNILLIKKNIQNLQLLVDYLSITNLAKQFEISVKDMSYIINFERFPVKTYIEGIKNKDDIILINEYSYLISFIDGFIIENEIFDNNNLETLVSIIRE